MKYIIEIKPEYEDSFKGVMILGAKDSNLFVDALAVEDLEELNSDYINEHFGSLQDDAYQRGLDDAWEAARKIADMWTRIDNDELLAIFGITERIGHSTIRAMFEKQTANEAMLELEAYEEKQKADDKIEVGDEVKRKTAPKNERGGIVTKEWKDIYYIMWQDGSSGQWDKDRVVKTGRHFDIASILEDMRCGQ